ncbi:hypothetical protein Ddye_026629 [Dipteronia dyeriana]|uniref:Uncharacterized protein n=1 Tax=Dipteronia dyeriana TaxID=168575 RepID=A0AAD9WPE0_9ROSI|nr:hypothetical protein Ddye_026629 [Dipteronia dyeriana]
MASERKSGSSVIGFPYQIQKLYSLPEGAEDYFIDKGKQKWVKVPKSNVNFHNIGNGKLNLEKRGEHWGKQIGSSDSDSSTEEEGDGQFIICRKWRGECSNKTNKKGYGVDRKWSLAIGPVNQDRKISSSGLDKGPGQVSIDPSLEDSIKAHLNELEAEFVKSKFRVDIGDFSQTLLLRPTEDDVQSEDFQEDRDDFDSCLDEDNVVGELASWARLDRFLISPLFLLLFQYLVQKGLLKSVSDHNVITLGVPKVDWGLCPFRFYNTDLEDKDLIKYAMEAKKKDSTLILNCEKHLEEIDRKAIVDGWTEELRIDRLDLLSVMWKEIRREEQIWM